MSFTHTSPVLCIGGFSDERLRIASEVGFSSVEVSFSELSTKTDGQLKDYLSLLDSLSLTPVAANGFFKNGLTPLFEPNFDRGALRDYIAHVFEATEPLGLSSISFGSGSMRCLPDGYEREKAEDFFCEFLLTEITPYLDKNDTYLNIEELQVSETNFINSCREAARLAERIGHPRIGVLCDFYHMSLAGETAEDVPNFAPFVRHVHLASPTSNRAIPHEKDGDDASYRAFFRALDASSYNGYFSLEGGIADANRFAEALADSFSYVSSLLAPYAEKAEETV